MFNKKIISLGPVTLLKVKEYQNREIFYLFNFLPLFSRQESLQKVVFTIVGIKITCRKHRPSETELLGRNAIYESGNGKTPAVKNSWETLTAMLNSDRSIARYGDGEFNLIFGENLPFQEYSPLLQQRLKEILQSENDSLMVAIPDIFASLEHYRPDVRNFWRKLLVNARSAVYALLKMDKQYFDSEVSRPYMNSADKSKVESFFQNFRKVWENKNIVFVEGEMSRLGVGNDLFSNAASIKRIIAPAKHAFRCYDEILSECKKQAADTLFIIALGPTATVLASDLAQTGFRALDLGHIDIEYEWFRMKAEQKVPVKNKYVNEVKKGRINTELTDTAYLQEIIKVIE